MPSSFHGLSCWSSCEGAGPVDVCASCRAVVYTQLRLTPSITEPGGPCEPCAACHGPDLGWDLAALCGAP